MRRLKKSASTIGLVAMLLLLTFAILSFERFHAVAVEDTSGDLERCMLTFKELLRQKGEGLKTTQTTAKEGSRSDQATMSALPCRTTARVSRRWIC